jgi:hypothetical protein
MLRTYLPYGSIRWESGATPTDFQFTGQRKEAGFGLYDYHARRVARPDAWAVRERG